MKIDTQAPAITDSENQGSRIRRLQDADALQ
jgi:hypothetical protein